MIDLNGTLVNVNNILTAKRYYTILKEPGYSERKDSPRLYLTFVGGTNSTIEFDNVEDLNTAFINLKTT